MLGFLIGLAVGGIIGVIVMAMLSLASKEDERMRDSHNNFDAQIGK